MITHRYRTLDVPVAGGSLRVGVWDPIEVAEGADVPSALLVHGITSSHLAWPCVVAELPGVRCIAPDLRGRGASHRLPGPVGMRAHATDLVAVVDALGIPRLPVIGHSMGGFVAVVLAHLAPERVSRLELVDGGLPIEVPPGFSPEQLVAAILGPTAERLSLRFDRVRDYLDFWRGHPAFADAWGPEVEDCFASDLVPEGSRLRPATTLEVTTADTSDLHDTGAGSAIREALEALATATIPARFISVPRGLRDEAPGLYATEHLARLLPGFPALSHVRLAGLNHYTLVMSERGGAALGALLRPILATGGRSAST